MTPARKWMLRTAGSLAMLGLLAWVLPAGEIWAHLSSLPPATVAVAIVACLGCHLIGAIKWQRILDAAAAPLRLVVSVRSYFFGLFGNVFLPSIIGGDIVAVATAYRHTANRPGLLLGTLINRLIDLGVLVALAAAGVVLAAQGTLPLASPRQEAAFGIVVLAAAVAATLVAARAARWLLRRSFKARRQAVKLRWALRSMRARPLTFCLAVGLGFVVQLGLFALSMLLGESIGLNMSLSVWLFAWSLAKVAAFLPISQAGIGTREAAFAMLTAPYGVPPALAVAASLAWQIVMLSANALAGGIAWLLGGQLPSGVGTGAGTGGRVRVAPRRVGH